MLAPMNLSYSSQSATGTHHGDPKPGKISSGGTKGKEKAQFGTAGKEKSAKGGISKIGEFVTLSADYKTRL